MSEQKQPPIGETIKAKLDEYEVERRLEEASERIEDVVHRGLEKAGEVTHAHRDRIDGFLDRAGEAFDKRTDGKYAEQVGKVRAQVDRGVDKLTAQRADGPTLPEPPAVEPPAEDPSSDGWSGTTDPV